METRDLPPGGDHYVAAHNSIRFRELRRRSNAFLLWACVCFFGWWFLGSVLATFVPNVFRQGLGGPVNVGLMFVLLSFVFVVTLAALYLRYARVHLDPLSEEIRTELEGAPR